MDKLELARNGGKAVSPQYPLPTSDMSVGTDVVSISAETVTFVGKAAAGSSGINVLDKRPVLNKAGDKVGSYWGQAKNRLWRTGTKNGKNPGNGGYVTALTETATAADITITDLNNNLELLFECATTARFVLRVYDQSGGSLYGFVEAIAASGNAYTFTIYNNPTFASGAQSWVGTLGSFDNTQPMVAEIYSYETSFAWVTGTVLTREVAYDFNVPDVEQLTRMSNGDYALDYETGKVLYKRKTTGGSDTCNYLTPSGNTTISTGDIEIGAVEGKDGTTDTRWTINAANTARTTSTTTLVTQNVDASGKVMAAGDAVGNAPFVKPTDGTTAVGVIAGTTALKTDTSSVAGTATSVSYGTSGNGVQRVAVARDARAAAPITANYVSPHDGSVAYTSSSTVTCSGFPFTVDDTNCTVTYIQIKPTAGTSWGAPYVNGMDGVSLIASANVITIYGAGTPFASGDSYRVGIKYQDKGYSLSDDANKVLVQNPVWARYTDPETLVSATPYELTASFADVGSEIDVRGYKYLTLWFTVDIGTSTNPEIRILHKHTSAGSEEYREIYLGSPAANITTINLNDYEVNSDADQLFKITLDVTGTAFVQVQAKDDANGDGQIDSLVVTKMY